jgi:hypothetical protein
MNSKRLSLGGTGFQPLDSWETADLGRWPRLIWDGPLALALAHASRSDPSIPAQFPVLG